MIISSIFQQIEFLKKEEIDFYVLMFNKIKYFNSPYTRVKANIKLYKNKNRYVWVSQGLY